MRMGPMRVGLVFARCKTNMLDLPYISGGSVGITVVYPPQEAERQHAGRAGGVKPLTVEPLYGIANSLAQTVNLLSNLSEALTASGTAF